MKGKSLMLPILLPLLSIIGVVSWAVGLGVVFIVLNETSLGVNGVIILGLVLIIVVPVIAWLVLSVTDKSKKESS